MSKGYRSFSWITDIPGLKTSIGDMLGIGFPKQPKLYPAITSQDDSAKYDEDWFKYTIEQKVLNHPANTLEYPFAGERIYDKPIVGFARGDDPIFYEFKKIIGPHHFTPEEIMAWQARNNNLKPPPAADLAVVSFILPINKRTRDENASQVDWTSERWAQTRRSGEIFSQTMVYEVVALLMQRGILAVAPDMTPMFHFKKYPGLGWTSPWSHRHIAYAAGLGSFGKHDLLITEKGSAHRCGSFVVNLKLQPDRVRNPDIHAHCLQYQGIDCLKCQARCPVDGISTDRHDKGICGKRVISSMKYCNRHYHIFIYGCGLCSTSTPCESEIPRALQHR